jgi:hypothetical protein
MNGGFRLTGTRFAWIRAFPRAVALFLTTALLLPGCLDQSQWDPEGSVTLESVSVEEAGEVALCIRILNTGKGYISLATVSIGIMTADGQRHCRSESTTVHIPPGKGYYWNLSIFLSEPEEVPADGGVEILECYFE